MLIYALIAARKCRGNSAPRKGSFFYALFCQNRIFPCENDGLRNEIDGLRKMG